MAFPLIKDELIDFINKRFGTENEDLDENRLLFSTGILDSFDMMEMITFIENQCGFKIKALDVNLDNLDSVRRILEYVGKRVDGESG